MPHAPSLRPRGRLAPSPTGDLHLGGAATFLVAWLQIRSLGGALVLRIEDLDPPRVVAGAEARLLEDLAWLGLDWDEGPDRGGAFGPYRQSERGALYEAAIERLSAQGSTYLCDCSRAEIARAASAPHAGEEGPLYPGTCRRFGMAPRDFKRPPAVRFAVPAGSYVDFYDEVYGQQREQVERSAGDFVLRRGDGVFAYQLAVVVDDLAMQIDHVVRGADLLSSTARQIWLARALNGAAPTYLHAPLMLDARGERLAKRARGVPVRDQREARRRPEQLLGALAHAVGLCPDDRPRSLQELMSHYQVGRVRKGAVRAPVSLLE